MSTPRGEKRHLVTLQGPGASVPDGEGGFTVTPTPLSPPDWYVQILPATARNMERVASGTTVSSASHILTGDYHPGVNTQTEILFEGRRFYVRGKVDPEEKHVETIAICEEVVT